VTSYNWPGNVRELKNVLQRYVLLGLRDHSALLDSPSSAVPEPIWSLPYQEARWEFERTYVTRALARAGGVIARAAELADVTRPSFHRMLARLNVQAGTASEPTDAAVGPDEPGRSRR